MKKTIILMMVVLLISILSGCVNDKTNSKIVAANTSDIQNISSEANISSEVNINNLDTKQLVTNASSNKGSDWCVPGNKLSEDNKFTIVGLTTYKGVDVCFAEMNKDNGKSTKYFSKDGKFNAMESTSSSGNAYSEARAEIRTNTSR